MAPLSRRAWLVVGISLALLCTIRALLPIVVERRVVAALARNERYAGSFDDVDVSVLGASYTIENLRLVKRNGLIPVPFVIAPRVEYALDRGALLHGHIAGAIAFSSPSLNLVDGPTPELRQGPIGVDWRITLRKLFPTRLNRVDIRDGTLHFRNFHTKPEVDVYLDDVEIQASNVVLRPGRPNGRVVRLRGRGVTMKSGSIEASFRLYRTTRQPSFDCTLSVRGAQLAEWSALLRAYVGLDVESGRAEIDADLRSRDGQLDGYVKPFVSELEALHFPAELAEASLLAPLREGLIDALAVLLRDPARHVIAARIPISGPLRDPQGDYWAGVQSLARNAFVEALEPGLDDHREH